MKHLVGRILTSNYMYFTEDEMGPNSTSDATILFNSFTHIYLVFCICFIYNALIFFVLCFEGTFGCKIKKEVNWR
jgi:hypothetical protein